MSNAFRAAFHQLVHRLRPFPVGSRLHDRQVEALHRGCSVGKWPTGVYRPPQSGVDRSIAFVLQITVPISGQIEGTARIPPTRFPDRTDTDRRR